MNLPQIEEKILKFWARRNIFKKSISQRKNAKPFVFFEGPPFANGLPGIHHLEARAFKDIVNRYKVMRGFLVGRKAGWDTHGLPPEIAAEKQLKIKTKKDIEKIGLEKFIEACRRSVFTYKKEWEVFSERIAFWLDYKNAYITCANEYIESVWWLIKQIWQKGYLYKDFKVVPYCPRCGTSLSSHEVAQGYEKIKENSIYFKLPVKAEPQSFFLVWTTTPWTLPGNTALAVGENITYVKARVGEQRYFLAKERLSVLDESYEIEGEFLGGTLIGREYEPVFAMKLDKPGYKVIAADFVSVADGTGIVHLAPAFGIEDMEAGKTHDLPILMTVDEEGKFKDEVVQWKGKFVKDADKEIVADLKKRKLLHKEEMYEHEYPFCWRCDTPLLYYAKTAWFIKMTALKQELLDNNDQINWVPDYIKHGRFGEWLEEVKDWNLSRERYWGTPLPVWECEKCDEIKVVGSAKELGKRLKDFHRPYIDAVVFDCPKCDGRMHRVPEVLDCWFDSGSMPYAQWHYPFENKEKIDEGQAFPADFICEAVDQTRGWFYTLLAISTLLGKGPSFKNVISLGHVLDAKGQKMSKSKGNVVKPMDVIEKYGADVARWYFYTVNQAGEPKRFDFKDINDKYNRFFGTYYNTYIFLKTYLDKKFKPRRAFKSKNLLDRWIVSRQNTLNLQMIKSLESYDVVSAARAFEEFVEEFSNWYVRRARRRFQKPQSAAEKNEAGQTLYQVLLACAKMSAPFIPFLSEEIYLGLKKGRMAESVHLCDYPEPDKKSINKKLEEKMVLAREIVAQALAERASSGIKVRQPLGQLMVKSEKLKAERQLLELIKEEVNVKKIVFDSSLKAEVKLDKKITKELKEEGIARELVRRIQDMRKELGLTRKDRIAISFKKQISNLKLKKLFANWQEFILKETLAQAPDELKTFKPDLEKELELEEGKVKIGIKKTK